MRQSEHQARSVGKLDEGPLCVEEEGSETLDNILDKQVIADCNVLEHPITRANSNPRIARGTLALQNYRNKVTHRPGTKMQQVDALSCSVGYVYELPLEKKLEFRQLAGPEVRKISADLELNENDRFKLIDGLVYKKVGEDYKFYIPEAANRKERETSLYPKRSNGNTPYRPFWTSSGNVRAI